MPGGAFKLQVIQRAQQPNSALPPKLRVPPGSRLRRSCRCSEVFIQVANIRQHALVIGPEDLFALFLRRLLSAAARSRRAGRSSGRATSASAINAQNERNHQPRERSWLLRQQRFYAPSRKVS